jgi:hypothetical protein
MSNSNNTNPRPVVVCLCGSTRFWRTFQEASLKETLAGRIVLSIGAASGTDDDHFGNLPREEYDRVKQELDALHFRKIEMADEVLILNVGGYIGESTGRELAHAQALGKRVRFWEEESAPAADLGNVAEVLAVNQELSAAEVKDIYENGIPDNLARRNLFHAEPAANALRDNLRELIDMARECGVESAHIIREPIVFEFSAFFGGANGKRVELQREAALAGLLVVLRFAATDGGAAGVETVE